MGTINIRLVTAIFAVSMLAASPFKAAAAPGVIADTPLFLSSAVQPNIFFAVDDSGSMGWSVLLSNAALTAHPGATNRNWIALPSDDTGDTITFDGELRELCYAYNVMAYNPNVNYTPWAGVNSAGNPYIDRTLANALDNPFNNGDIDNLNGHFYFPWTDADGDGEYDPGECPDDFNSFEVGGDGDTAVTVSDCRTGNAAAAGCQAVADLATTAEQTNYANWYTYYRQREYVTKKALSELIIRSTERMGLGTLHNHNTVGTPIADVDDITTPVNATAKTSKTALMRQLFRIRSQNGTPLRQTLEEAGEYFSGGNPGGLFGGANPGDPILGLAEGGACQQNFTVLLSDGFWNGANPNVGNADGDNSTTWDGGPYADAVNNTLADVAMRYYETDLDTGLPAQVKVVPGRDSNTQQHMNTYTVAFGVNGTLAAGPADGDTAFAWPTPVQNTNTTIDDLRHAAFNGRGLFLSAGDPQELIDSLVGAISDISDVTGTAAAVSFNSTVIDTGSLVFQASFNTEGWYGDLEAIRIDPDDPSIKTTAWLAGGKLASRNLASNPRNIVTFNGAGGVAFDFPADYTDAATNEMDDPQILDILANAPFAANTNDTDEIAENQQYGEDLVAFLRGDHSNEAPDGQGFRNRDNRRLGDIINSSPAFVGAPNTAYPDNIEATPYSDFVAAWKTRTPRVYVGANDGMLHAFDALGNEVFAYIPGSVYSDASGAGLHTLAEPDYTHKYYVDLSPKTADVYWGGGWKTVLVGGLRAGGQGIFALDITNPASLTEANAAGTVLWEYTDKDLGFTFSDIQIGRLANGRWAAIFGNGYNDSGDGRAKLYIKYLDDADDVVILDTNVGTSDGDCSDPANDCNGMSTPALADLNGDGIIDRIYAGDLHGNMWVVDVEDNNDGDWDFAFKDGSDPRPLFQACGGATCTDANRQPITSKPDLARHPNRTKITTSPNILVFFGTGQYMTSADNSSSLQQTFYGVWDGGWSGGSALTRGNLQSQTLTVDATTGNRSLTSNAVNYSTSGSGAEYGWYIDLNDTSPGTGATERVVSDPVVIGDIAFFSTLIPSTSVCAEGGEGWRLTVDMLTGGLPQFAVVDLNNDGDFSNDPVIAGQKFTGIQVSPKLIATGEEGVLYRFSPEADRVKARDSQSENRTSWTNLDY